MKVVRIPLLPNTRFHFGKFKIDVNLGLSSTSLFAHSDTLFSALVNSYNEIYDAGIFVNAFKESCINISSLFYYLKNGDKFIYFLPKPIFLETDSKTDGNHKLRNKIKFVSLKIWQQGFNQEKWDNKLEYKIIQNQFIVLKSEYEDFVLETGLSILNICKTVQSPKSPIRKNSEDDSIYYQTDIEISDNGHKIETGFYFMYNTDLKSDEMLKDAVNVMSKSGIGGEKNNMGRIMGDPIYEDLNLNIKSTNYTNISLVSPKDLTDFNKIKLYKTIIRGGRKLNHGGQYKTVRMIIEGAKIESELEGQIIKIGIDDNNNEAVRYGKAFLIPVL